jgi:hypothetical protein
MQLSKASMFASILSIGAFSCGPNTISIPELRSRISDAQSCRAGDTCEIAIPRCSCPTPLNEASVRALVDADYACPYDTWECDNELYDYLQVGKAWCEKGRCRTFASEQEMLDYISACMVGWWCRQIEADCIYYPNCCRSAPCATAQAPDCAPIHAFYFGPTPMRQHLEPIIIVSAQERLFTWCSPWDASSWRVSIIYASSCDGQMSYAGYDMTRCDSAIAAGLEDARTDHLRHDVPY